MHNELRYQTKTHTIFEKQLSKKIKIQHLFLQFFFFVENNEIEKQQKHAYTEKKTV
jgi:hypothetical protein